MAPRYEESLTGKTFEKCRILAKLGTGGMGSVWLAEHFGLGRKVAVKILPPEMGRDPEYVARFMREATTAGRMEHPNIVQIHDVGYAEGRHFIVMQYVDGESLSTVVENLGAMEPKDAAKIAAGMLRGLQHAHEEGVVHRDVKPDNVIIAKGDEPKLLDFGLAIETETALQITKDGMVVGTPYYLAPEQARGQKATPLCDIYAAGVTLYYLLTGKRPFVGATALAVLNKHIHEPPVPPMKHKADIPKPLNDIVLKMMAKKPADRYQSAGAAADDLESFLKGKQVQVRIPVQLPFGLDRLTKKQQILAFSGAGSVVLLLLVLLIVAFTGGSPKVTKGGIQPPPPTPVAEVPENTQLLECMKFEQKNKDLIDAYPEVFNRYDLYINSTASPAYVEKGKQAKKAFYDQVEKRANDELDRCLKEADPYLRMKALALYPRTLQDLTGIDKRLREERNLTGGAVEAKYLDDERKLDFALRESRFRDAEKLLGGLLGIANGARLQRLERLKADLPRMEREFEDAVLRRLTQDYAAVHADFSKFLVKRENAAAYTRVTRFLKELDEVEKLRARVAQGVNYDAVLIAVPDPVLTDAKLGQVRLSLVTGFAKAQDALPYRILADLQDALDVEFLIRSAGLGLKELSRGTTELRLATFGSTGRITIGEKGLAFAIKNGPTKTIVIKELHPLDLLQLAAAAESQTAEQVYESNDQLCRAAGAAYLYSERPERWAQAARWYRRAEQLGTPGLGFRLEGFREQGYQEVRDRIALSKKELERKNFEGAKSPLSAVETAWAHDPVLKEEIGRAMAAILTAEVLQHDRTHEYAKLKAAARALRTNYKNLYQEDVIFGPYAHAMRETGDWQSAGSLFNNEWTWEGKGTGAMAPADDDTKLGRGLRLKPDKSIELAPVKTRGASGATVMLTVSNTFTSFAAGLRFDAAKDGSYRRLVVRDTGELTLYSHDGREEIRSMTQPIGKKIVAGQWVELTYVAEGGDIVCYFEQRPLILFAAPVPTDRDIGLCSTAEANFRLMKIRK